MIYNPANPNPSEFATVMQTADRWLVDDGVPDPTLDLYSATNDSQGALLANTLASGLDEIIRGLRDVSQLDRLVQDWRSGGGDQIRSELQQALSAARG